MIVRAGTPAARPASRRPWLAACVVGLTTVAATACNATDDAATSDATAGADGPVELRDEIGPHVDAPDRSMAMTVDALDIADGDILVRVRVSNSDDRYLDLGVQDTIYGPLLTMSDDRGNLYDSYAVEPAGIPGRRVADLSFRLEGPLDRDARSFTLEIATQRGTLTSPSAALPRRDAIRWRVDGQAGATAISSDTGQDESDPVFAAAPRLPDLIHFWLETDPLPAGS